MLPVKDYPLQGVLRMNHYAPTLFSRLYDAVDPTINARCEQILMNFFVTKASEKSAKLGL